MEHILILCMIEIKHCIGCTDCWLKTPGICTILNEWLERVVVNMHSESLGAISISEKEVV